MRPPAIVVDKAAENVTPEAREAAALIANLRLARGTFAYDAVEVALQSFEAGEIDWQVLSRLTSVSCELLPPPKGAKLALDTIKRVAGMRPRALNRSRPPVPRPVRRLAVHVLWNLTLRCPDGLLAPQKPSNTSALLDAALHVLEEIGFVPALGRVRPETLYRWYRESGRFHPRRRGRRQRVST